jgi:hypothetical protein
MGRPRAVVAFGALVAVASLTAGCGSNGVVPALAPLVPLGSAVRGRSYSEWDVAEVKWRFGLALNHATPTAGMCISAGQPSHVWFLEGDYAVKSATRACVVPPERYVVVAGPGWVCSNLEFSHPTSAAGLERCARDDWSRKPPRYSLFLDGRKLKPSGFLVATPEFAFTMPRTDNALDTPGPGRAIHGKTSGYAVSYGLTAILRPLAPGRHVLVREEQYPGEHSPVRTTYEIKVPKLA